MAGFKGLLGLALLCIMAIGAVGESELRYGRHLLQRPRKCEAISHFDFFGNDIRRIDHIFSWQRCCHICRNTHGCKGYTWRADFHHCWLKHTLANYKYCANCYTQDLFIPIPPKPCHPIHGYGYFGHNIGVIKHVFSFRRCCRLCHQHHGCVAYTWRSDLHTCFLKRNTSHYKYCASCVSEAIH